MPARYGYVGGTAGLSSVAKSGGDVRTIVTGEAGAVAVAATNVYYYTRDSVMTACK